MSFPAWLAGAGLVLLGAAVSPRVADACSEGPPGVFDRDVLPLPGAIDVPVNARLSIRYARLDVAVPSTATLVADGGDVVEVDVEVVDEPDATTVILQPRARLTAGTRYRVLDRILLVDECEASEAAPCLGEDAEVATFTTGDAADTAPPTGGDATVETRYVSDGDDDCRSGSRVSHRATIVDVSDEQPAGSLRYNVYDDQSRRLRTAITYVHVSHTCPAGADDFDRFSVRVVDVAGNESASYELTGRSCASFEEDGGCSAGGGAGLLVGLAALALRRRRTRH